MITWHNAVDQRERRILHNASAGAILGRNRANIAQLHPTTGGRGQGARPRTTARAFDL